MLLLRVLVGFVFLASVEAECPNGCSGHGACTSKDMCQCYKNFQGNDCSERTCGFGYAHTDTPKGDLNMDKDLTDVAVTTPVYHASTYERYPSSTDNEGHFYMECSNQGLCDREVGDCVCFDGFEGSACQRASCPNACSNHGSCESIREFATTAGGTLFTKGLASGSTTYDLWDAKVSYGCRCDPWFTGADCSQRLCKVGVDPMFYDTEQITYETISLKLHNEEDKIRIRFWDYYGESFITAPIDVSSSEKEKNIEDALKALPNGVISDALTCETASDQTFFDYAADTTDFTVVCQFASNPGALRLPELIESSKADTKLIGTPLRGEDETLTPTLSSYTITKIEDDTTVTKLVLSGESSDFTASGKKLIKVDGRYLVVVGSGTVDGITTLQVKLNILKDGDSLSKHFYHGSGTVGDEESATDTDGAVLTFTGDTAPFAAKDKIICDSQILNVVSTANGETTSTVTVDREYLGTLPTCHTLETSSQTPYVYECAGRGRCDRETGVCSCFTGFTNDNCDRQSIMAF